MIHMALCFHNQKEFYKNAYITLLSCFMNTSSPLHVHMVVDESVHPFKELFLGLAAGHGHAMTFHAAPAIPEDVLSIFRDNTIFSYTPAALYRMFLHEIVEADKIIYVDCDIVFERDIAELDAFALGDAWILATHDPERRFSTHKKSYYLDKLDIREDRYFNSGVMVMNLSRLREASSDGNVFMNYYRKLAPLANSLSYIIYDQDLLNAMLSRDEDKLVLVSPDFNYELCLFQRRSLPLEKLTGKIFHFAALKPWEKFFPVHLLYWKYYAKTPWSDELFPLMSERLTDTRDRRMRQFLFCWKHPGYFKWLWKLLDNSLTRRLLRIKD